MARRLVDNRPFDAAMPPAPQARWYTNLSTALLILMQARLRRRLSSPAQSCVSLTRRRGSSTECG